MKLKITQVDRVLGILKLLSTGAKITLSKNHKTNEIILIEQLKKSDARFDYLDIGLKSLQNDMVYVREYLGDNLIKKTHSYKLMEKDYLEELFKEDYKEVKKFFHAISLIDQSVFSGKFSKYKTYLAEMEKKQKEVYLFLENPFENLKKLDLKDKLEQYIQDKRYIDIDYYSDKLHIFKRVQPYKIIYQNGNWYLAVLTTEDCDENDGFRLLRFNFIEKVNSCRFEPYRFHEDVKVKEFLENKFQSLFTSFNRDFFTVKVRINSKKAARRFKVKQYLKSQRIIGEMDGDLLVEFTINDEMEIIPLIQTWMPHITVIEPLYLHQKILDNIKNYPTIMP